MASLVILCNDSIMLVKVKWHYGEYLCIIRCTRLEKCVLYDNI